MVCCNEIVCSFPENFLRLTNYFVRLQTIVVIHKIVLMSWKSCAPPKNCAKVLEKLCPSKKYCACPANFLFLQKNCARFVKILCTSQKIEQYRKTCDRVRKNCARIQNILSTSQNIVCPSAEFFGQVNNFFKDVKYFVNNSTIFWGYKVLCTSVRLFGQADNFCVGEQNWRYTR
jgi:hypothetical protein